MSISRVFILCAVVLAFAGHYAAYARQTPSSPPSAQSTAAKHETLLHGNAEHGQYIAEHVAMCVECHSGRDEKGNILDAEKYLGGAIPFMPPWPNDWAPRAPRNKGLPGYDDEQALRLLTQGAIGRDGAQLRPPMPRFRMSPQDAADVIAFLRSVP